MSYEAQQQTSLLLTKIDNLFLEALRAKGLGYNEIEAKKDAVKKMIETKIEKSNEAFDDFVSLCQCMLNNDITVDKILIIMMCKEITQIMNFKEEIDDSIVDYLVWRFYYIVYTDAISLFRFDVY